MTQESWEFLDPETVAIRREEMRAREHAACGNCIHRQTVEFRGQEINACDQFRKYGIRCDLFKKAQS